MLREAGVSGIEGGTDAGKEGALSDSMFSTATATQLQMTAAAAAVASQRLRDAQQSLQQAAQQARQQSQGSGQGEEQRDGESGEGEEEGREDGAHGQDRRAELEIPTREEFRTPEEYRRALLEGMEGEVPEEYRAMKKRYYEELVHQ